MIDRRTFLLLAAAGLLGGGSPVRSVLADTRVDADANALRNGEFNWYPQRSPSGPVVIIVSIPDQMVHVYRNGVRIAASTCSTGKPGHGTPRGVFKILQKDKHHRSSTYNNAPMPNMNRLTWSGVALHAGNLPGYPASHGCVRLPLGFSELLFGITKLGMTVVIADESSQPSSVVHPGMVLGDYARKEFDAVDVSIKRHQYSVGRTEAPSTSSVVVSARDRTATLFENGDVIASGGVDIANPDRPIGDHVYVLNRVNERTGELGWISSAYSASERDVDERALKRIRAHDDILARIRRKMHPGMTLVATDASSDRSHRSNGNFTIFSGVGLY